MKTFITTLLVTISLFTSVIKSCLAQQPTLATATSAVTTSVGATAPADRSVKATSVGAYKLTVVLSAVNKRSGKLYVGLANNAETFEKESLVNKIVDVPASGEITVTFDSLAAGQYAVRVYQDLNDNKKIDFSGMIPTEPFGFSNMTMVMGPPEFGQCAFDLAEDKRISVSMIEM